MAQPHIGEEVAGFVLQERIASGGMGVVFRAQHKTLDRTAAIKILAPRLAGDPEIVSRFLNEARIANDLRHPCIVDIFDFVDVETPRRVACVMELLDGPTLADVVRKKPLRIGQALNAMMQLTDALAAVHARGVVHRDLKPQNIIVVGSLDSELMAVPSVKILDFGIAKVTEAPTEHRTRTGSVMGTPAYMAPEQVAASDVSTATDLYALAEIFFEMVSGRRVFEGDNLQILAQKMAKAPPKFELPPTVYGHDRILALVSACLNPDPERRPSIKDFSAAIDDLNEEVYGDGAATVLDARPEIDTAPDAAFDIPQMNTQMFFDRIALDIAEEPGVTDTEPPPPPPMAEQEEHLTLMRGGWSPEAAPEPEPRAPSLRRPAERRPSTSASPRVVVGQRVRTKPAKRSWLLPLVVIVSLVGLLGTAIWWVPRLGWFDGPLGASPLAEKADTWSRTHGGFTGRIDALLDEARSHINADEIPRYDAALDALMKALVADPSHPSAIGLYVEARTLRAPGSITRAEAAVLQAALAHAEAIDGPTVETARGRAALSFATGAAGVGAAAIAPYASPEARLRLAEGQASTAPRKALATLLDEAVRALPRAVLVRARARRNLGRFRAASDTLAARLTDPSVTPEIQLEQALVDAAVGRDRAAIGMFKQAAEGSARARLEYAMWRAGRGDDEAGEALVAIADDTTVQERLRLQALLAETARRRTKGESIQPLAERAQRIDGEATDSIRIGAEAALDEGQSKRAHDLSFALLQRSPDSVFARVVRFTAAMMASDPLGARGALEEAIDRTPRDPRLRLLLGVVHLTLQDAAAAGAVIDAIGELDPLLPRADERFDVFPRAAWLEADKQLLLAKKDKALTPAARTLAALLDFHTAEPDVAGKSLSGIRTPPLAVLTHLAQLELDRRSWRKAERHTRAMSKLAPKAIATNLFAARVASARGQHRRAVGIYERLMLASDAPFLKVEHALALFSDDKRQGAAALAQIATTAMFFEPARPALYAAKI